MEQKKNWVALRRDTAKRSGLSLKDTERLLDAWLDCMKEALQRGEQIKLNELGILRVQNMAPRKSVDVTTGEPILLAGYKRLQFTPSEAAIRQVNETEDKHITPDDDPIRKLGEQADEILDLLGELGQGPRAELNEKETPVVDMPEEAPVVDVPTEAPVIDPKPTVKPQLVEITKEEQEEDPLLGSTIESTKTEKKRSMLPTILLTIAFFLLLLGCGYYLLQRKMTTWIDMLHDKIATQTTTVSTATTSSSTITTSNSTITTTDSIGEYVNEQTTTLQKVEERIYTEYIASENLAEGSRLSWVAYKYYKRKDLWVYLYEANKDHIEHPGNIPVGTLIRVPKIPTAWMDLSIPGVKQQLDSLATIYSNL